MPEQGIRSAYSQCPFQLEVHDCHGVISTGSAFLFEFETELFLITNWHIVSGKHFISSELLLRGRCPTHLTAKLFFDDPNPSGEQPTTFGICPHTIPLYRDDKPVWFEHPNLGHLCDAVALPFDRPSICTEDMHTPANRISRIRIPVLPGCTVFIIGFPSSISVGPGLPLWKSGYIASEPHFDVTIGGKPWEYGGLRGGTRLPAFFIDSQTREGMSGSPVFANYVGNWDSADPYGKWNPRAPGFSNRKDVFLGTQAKEFVGCYSGRIGSREEGAALGLCWRKDQIEDICRGRRLGAHPHFQTR